MADNVTFQTSVTATPPNATVVATDEISSAHYQWFKLAYGDNGTAYALSYGTPLPIGTLPGGTFVVNGTPQVLGSVSIVGTLAGGSVGIVGTIQVLGTIQIHGTAQVLGTVQTHGTSQIIGTVQPLAGSVHLASGTVQVLGTFQSHGTNQALGTVQPLAGSVHPASVFFGSVQGFANHDAAVAGAPVLIGAFGSSGTQAAVSDGDAVRLAADLNGRLQVAGTILAPLPAGNNNIGDVDVVSMPTVTVTATNLDIRDLTSASDSVSVVGTVQTHGTSQVIGTVQTAGTVDVGTVRFIVGTVHVGTVQRIQGGTIDSFGGTLGGGTVQVHGTAQALGTVQPLAGSVHLATNLAGGTVVVVGSAVHGAVADTRPLLISAFGSSGTQAAVDDGDSVRLWADLNGRLQIRGTIDSMPAVNVSTGTIPGGTIQLHGTSEVLGTVRALTTVEVTFGSIQGWQANGGAAAGNPVLMGGFGSSGTQAAVDDGDAVRAWFDLNGRQHITGTVQGLPGSVHLATNLAGGTVVAVGSAVHGAAADTRPLLMAAFGSSGTQAAVDDGDSTRLWADLNGRLQVRGTIDSIPNITITAGTVSLNTGGTVHVGTVQRLAGGTIDSFGGTVLGTVAVQGLVAHDAGAAGNPLQQGGVASRARPGTVTDGDAVRAYFDQHGRQVVQVGLGTTEPHGTTFTGAGANGTILTARGVGSFWRIYDILLSGSGGGTFALMMDTTVIWGPLFIANNGGWSFNSAVGVRLPTANSSLNARFTAGTWSLFMNYGLEGV